MARSFRYRVAVPYQEWMKDALLLIHSAGVRLPRQTGKHIRGQDCRQAEPAQSTHFCLGHGYGQEVPDMGELHRARAGQGYAAVLSRGLSPISAKSSGTRGKGRLGDCP